MYCNAAIGILIIAVYIYLVSPCPLYCTCITYSNGLLVNCSNRGLTVIPTTFPDESYIIHMESNPITTIGEGAFRNLSLLYAVYLKYCDIATIEPGAFVHLPNLLYMRLQYIQITTIQQGTFKDLPTLYSLSLEKNKIIKIEQGAFQNLTGLRHLYLDLVCDCNIGFWSWLQSKTSLRKLVTCLDRNNVYMSSLEESDFGNCTYDLCHPDYCSNGGSCSQNSYGDLMCSCVGNWTGVTCTAEV